MFRKVTILGVGLIGGSLGMAIKKHQLAREVVGFSQRQSSLVQAMKVKAIDIAQPDAQKAVHNADLVILATPVNTIIKMMLSIASHVKRGCIVTDVGSAKAEIVETGEKVMPIPGFFVGSHPLTGSEKKGVDFARSDLFHNSICIMTPTKITNPGAKEKIQALWTKVGATVKILSPEEHDEILAYISHLPHLAAFGLISTVPKPFLELSSSGLKDTTRIAASSPQMWNDICMANSKKIIKSLDEYVKNLSLLRRAIVEKNQQDLTTLFAQAKEKRDAIKQ